MYCMILSVTCKARYRVITGGGLRLFIIDERLYFHLQLNNHVSSDDTLVIPGFVGFNLYIAPLSQCVIYHVSLSIGYSIIF